MKKLIYITAIILGISNFANAQNTADQNSNANNSKDKYTKLSSTTENTQSTTVQNTYQVTDWREEKLKRQELQATRKHELKKLRLEAKIENRKLRNQRPYSTPNRYPRRSRRNRYPRSYYGNNSYNNNSPYYYNY